MGEETQKEETQMTLQEYKTLEAHLYGEITKACRQYSGRLSIITILGILDLAKQEIKELEKTNINYKEDQPIDEFVTNRLS